MPSINLKRVFAWAAVVGIAVMMVRMFARPPESFRDHDEDEQSGGAAKSVSTVTVEDGRTVLTFDPKAQSRAGIIVASPKVMVSRQRTTAPAVVLSAQELIRRRAAYVSALARLDKARANRDVSQQGFDRVKALYQEDRNASQKALESAQGTLRNDRAELESAQQDLVLQSAALRQDWGQVIAQWVINDTAALHRVFEQADWFVQVTMPQGTRSMAAEIISIELPRSESVKAKLVSTFPHVDPRIQGMSFIYVIPSQPGLAPGLNLVADLEVGGMIRGVCVPHQAVLWWQGQAWVYKQTAPGRFVRQEVPTDAQIECGFFVPRGISPGDAVVMTGAQILLSAELGRQAQGGEEDND